MNVLQFSFSNTINFDKKIPVANMIMHIYIHIYKLAFLNSSIKFMTIIGTK